MNASQFSSGSSRSIMTKFSCQTLFRDVSIDIFRDENHSQFYAIQNLFAIFPREFSIETITGDGDGGGGGRAAASIHMWKD